MKLRIGIIGLGKIAPRVAKGILNSEYGSLYAVASRDYNNAIKFANDYGALKAYGNYEDLVKDEKIDIVYIATVNETHFDLIKLCADNHKNVICEKPLVKNTEETIEIFDYCKDKNVFLMEAQKACFTDLNNKIHALINDGILGKIKVIYASFVTKDKYPKDHFVMDKVYGGVFKDIGVYCIAYANYMAMSKIDEVEILELVKEDGVDVRGKLHLRYNNDIDAYIRTGFDINLKNFAVIEGSRGTIMCEDFWKSDVAYLVLNNQLYEIKNKHISEFSGEIDHACICIYTGIGNSHTYGKKDSIEVAKVIDFIKEAKDEKRD